MTILDKSITRQDGKRYHTCELLRGMQVYNNEICHNCYPDFLSINKKRQINTNTGVNSNYTKKKR